MSSSIHYLVFWYWCEHDGGKLMLFTVENSAIVVALLWNGRYYQIALKCSETFLLLEIKCERDPPPSARGSAGRRARAGCSPAESCQIFPRQLKYFCYGWDLFVIRILSTSSCSPSSRSAHIHSNLRRNIKLVHTLSLGWSLQCLQCNAKYATTLLASQIALQRMRVFQTINNINSVEAEVDECG